MFPAPWWSDAMVYAYAGGMMCLILAAVSLLAWAWMGRRG